MPSSIAASLFPSPTSLALFRPSAPRPFHIVGKSCGAVVPRSLSAVPLLLVRLLPYGITYRDEKDKRRAENICTSKRSEVGNGIKSEEEGGSGSKLLWGILDRQREGTPTFCLTAITARTTVGAAASVCVESHRHRRKHGGPSIGG